MAGIRGDVVSRYSKREYGLSGERIQGSRGVDVYTFPYDDGWQEVSDVPKSFRQVVELAMMARADGKYIEDVGVGEVSLDDIYDIYDGWGEAQDVLTVSDDGDVVGVLSYYYDSGGVPFIEAVAVNPSSQDAGVGSRLIDTALERISSESHAEVAMAMAQQRVSGLYERKWGAMPVDATEGGSEMVLMMIPIPR